MGEIIKPSIRTYIDSITKESKDFTVVAEKVGAEYFQGNQYRVFNLVICKNNNGKFFIMTISDQNESAPMAPFMDYDDFDSAKTAFDELKTEINPELKKVE